MKGKAENCKVWREGKGWREARKEPFE